MQYEFNNHDIYLKWSQKIFFEGLNSLLCALPTYSKCTLSNLLPPRRAHVTLIDLMVSITVDRLASKWQLIKSDIVFVNMMRTGSLLSFCFQYMVCQTYPVPVIEFMFSLYLQVLFVSYVGAIIVVEPILELVHKWASMFSLLWVLLKCISVPDRLLRLKPVNYVPSGYTNWVGSVTYRRWILQSVSDSLNNPEQRLMFSSSRNLLPFFVRPKFDHCLDLAHHYAIFLSSLDV